MPRGSSLNSKERFNIARNGHLEIHSMDLVDLCSEYGTPLFVFDEERLRENYRRFRQAFEKYYPKTIVCYSIKTNCNLAICTIMQQEGAYAEAASGLDLYIAEKAGFTPERIIFDGLCKSETALREALEKRVLLVNVESFSELDRLNRIAGELGVKQKIGLRVNPFRLRIFDVRKNFFNAIHCNPSSRFGFSLKNAFTAFERASKLENLQVEGVMAHPYQGATDVLLPLVKRIHREPGIQIQYLNLGGGFDYGTTRSIGTVDLIKDFFRQKIGLSSKLDKETIITNIEEIGKSITSAVKLILEDVPEPTLILEPGRYIVGDAGILLLRVDHIKEAGGYKWIIVDGGTNFIPNYMERHKIQIANRVSEEPTEVVNIAGPTPDSNDLVSIKKRLPKVREGDLLAVLDSGAYTLSKATQFLYPRPHVVLLNARGGVKEIRENETYEDILRKDRII